jgi:hypothetical protein
MKEQIKERVDPKFAAAGKSQAEYRSQGIRRSPQCCGLVREDRRGVVGGNQADAQQNERDHLLRDFVWSPPAVGHD